MQCFHATVNRDRTRFLKETEVTNRETISRVVFIRLLELLTRRTLESLLDSNKDHLLNQARSELLKQEHQVGSLNKCIDELQKQAYAQRLELEDAHPGFAESRREKVRLEELVMKEKALRDTQIRNVHETAEMKRAQEIRVEEFSVQKLRESHETIQRVTSQIQEMQGQMNSMNDSGEFQKVESNHSARLSLRSQSTSSESKLSSYAEPRQTLAIWHMEYDWTTGNRFW